MEHIFSDDMKPLRRLNKKNRLIKLFSLSGSVGRPVRRRCIEARLTSRIDLDNIRQMGRPITGPDLVLGGNDEGVANPEAVDLVTYLYRNNKPRAVTLSRETREMLVIDEEEEREALVIEHRKRKRMRLTG